MKRINIYVAAVLITACILIPQLSFSQIQAVNFQQLDSLQNIEKRPVVVFLHTSWCKYCGAMKNTTFKNKDVVKVLQQKYYFVSLDVEEKADILFRGHTFRYKPTGTNTGVHELAEQLGNIKGAISYPSICFLNADYEIIFQKEGYLGSKDFLTILTLLKK